MEEAQIPLVKQLVVEIFLLQYLLELVKVSTASNLGVGERFFDCFQVVAESQPVCVTPGSGITLVSTGYLIANAQHDSVPMRKLPLARRCNVLLPQAQPLVI